MRVANLFIYPVKSLRGCAVPSTGLDDRGFAQDRRLMVVDAGGKFLTQRSHPQMARVSTKLDGTHLTLSADDAGAVTVSTQPDAGAPLRTVSIWKHDNLLAEDCGHDAAQWLSSFLGQTVYLVRIGEKFRRFVLKTAARPGDAYAFNDGSPVLVTSEASLNALNDRIQEDGGEPVPMDQFRPNLVLSGCAPFTEDTAPYLRMGEIMLRNAGKSDRCVVTTTNQLTGARGKEPLKTLARFRRDPALDPTAVYFGTNFINESKRGTIRVGDAVTVSPP